jgi:HD domain-containing protein
MPAQRDIGRARGRVSSAVLAERLGQAVDRRATGTGRHNGNGAIGVPSAREVALDVCRAILAEAGAGTAEHSDDVVLITEAIGERMGFAGGDADDLVVAAQLHDIGKAWVPSRILAKAGPLTDEEWALMRRHTIVGEEILSAVDELAGVGRLVRHSHERWDGEGYPDGVKGAEIPLGSRIIFCADTFHAIRSDRPYRRGSSADEALAEIRRCSGTQFDPAVAEALEEVVRERRSRPRGMRSSRLFALLMCLVVGGAGTALARSDLLGERGAPSSSPPTPPPACGTAGCPSVAGPVGGLAPVGVPGSAPGPRVVHPGLPGRLHGGVAGGKRHGAGGAPGQGDADQAQHGAGSKSHGRALGRSEDSHSGGKSSSHGASGPSPSSSAHGGTSGTASRGPHHWSGSSHAGGSNHSSGSGHSGGNHHSSSGGGSGSSKAHGGGSGDSGTHGSSGSSGSTGSHGK